MNFRHFPVLLLSLFVSACMHVEPVCTDANLVDLPLAGAYERMESLVSGRTMATSVMNVHREGPGKYFYVNVGTNLAPDPERGSYDGLHRFRSCRIGQDIYLELPTKAKLEGEAAERDTFYLARLQGDLTSACPTLNAVPLYTNSTQVPSLSSSSWLAVKDNRKVVASEFVAAMVAFVPEGLVYRKMCPTE